jgi:hypothetical protein
MFKSCPSKTIKKAFRVEGLSYIVLLTILQSGKTSTLRLVNNNFDNNASSCESHKIVCKYGNPNKKISQIMAKK